MNASCNWVDVFSSVQFSSCVANKLTKRCRHRPHSMRSGIYVTVERPAVCHSVCPIDRQQQRWPAGLLLSAVRARDIDRQPPAPRTSCRRAKQQRRRSSKCGQCHVDFGSLGTRLNTDLLSINQSINQLISHEFYSGPSNKNHFRIHWRWGIIYRRSMIVSVNEAWNRNVLDAGGR